MLGWEKAVYVDVCTFDSLKEKGRMVISLIEDILKHFFLPYRSPLKIYLERFDFKSQSFEYNIKAWNKVVSMVLNGEIRHLLINYTQNEELHQPELALSITFDYSYNDALLEDTVIANNIALSINRRIFNLNIPIDVQNMLKETFINVFQDLNGVIGYINMGIPHATIAPNATSFEGLQGYYFTEYSHMFGIYARGYFWGNVLTEKHIEKLGGISVIKEKAPCCIVNDFVFGDGRKAVYLQLSEDINLYTDEQLKHLRDFFKSVLPEKNMEYMNQADPSGEIRKSARVFFD